MSGGRNASAAGMEMIKTRGMTRKSGCGAARRQTWRNLVADVAMVAALIPAPVAAWWGATALGEPRSGDQGAADTTSLSCANRSVPRSMPGRASTPDTESDVSQATE
ncbi:hypothetical protein SY2F82_41070 [Streptomyces sp. Y2F8-2]|nr:hypothetical protein SY2F82_41070 [Streptomyces sp. Y2F8-2]